MVYSMKKKTAEDQYSDKEAAARRDAINLANSSASTCEKWASTPNCLTSWTEIQNPAIKRNCRRPNGRDCGSSRLRRRNNTIATTRQALVDSMHEAIEDCFSDSHVSGPEPRGTVVSHLVLGVLDRVSNPALSGHLVKAPKYADQHWDPDR
jgi:hypothetical protein